MMSKTYEIHIDESGSFERSQEGTNENIRLVGGVVVPEGLQRRHDDLKKELMEQVAQKFFINPRFVTDIHMSDPKKLKPGKKTWQLREAMQLFFNEKMSGVEIAFVYDATNLEAETSLPGAQRYRYMLVELLKALVFYHPRFNKTDSFEVKLAHRRITYPMGFDQNLADQGYLKLKNLKGMTQFTAITKADLKSMMDQMAQCLSFKNTRAFYYDMQPYREWDNPFMVMADFVCNTIYRLFRDNDYSASRLYKELRNTFGKNSILYYAPSDYDFPVNLLSEFHLNRLDNFIVEYLKINETRESKNALIDQNLLKPAVLFSLQQLRQTTDANECRNIIALADNFLSNHLFYRFGDVGGLIGLVKIKLDTVADNPPDTVWDPIAYLYHNVCLRYCNHTANTVQALIHKKKGIQLFERSIEKDLTQIRQHHEFINRTSVWDSNEFAFLRATKTLEGIKAKEEQISKIVGADRNEILGKIYGSLAQNYSFLGKYAIAKSYYEEAAKHLGRGNPMQTSFRAHLALDMKNKRAFEEEICFLFDKSTFPGYQELLNACLTNLNENAFNLHLILKGLIVFPLEGENIKESLMNLADVIHPLKRKRENHPWELIYTVMGRLLSKLDQSPPACQFWKAAAEFAMNNDQLTFIMLGHAARAWESVFWLEAGKLEKAREILFPLNETLAHLKTANSAIGIFNPNNINDEDGEARAGWFDGVGRKMFEELKTADGRVLSSLVKEFLGRFTFNYW